MRSGRTQACVAAVALAGATLISSAAGASAATSARPAAESGPCGLLIYDGSHRPTYQHVIVIMDENLSYSSYVASTQLDYLHGLAAACGSETDMHAATHPSQPNYMAATSGVATGSGDPSGNDNVFHQAQVAGKTWRNYAESMPAHCSRSSSTVPAYKTGHTPAFWYTDLTGPKSSCATNDVPLSPALDTAIANDALPNYAWITPNACNDMHWLSSCSYPTTSRMAAGDAWLSTLLPQLTALPSYLNGKTLIIITFDEGEEDSTTGVDCADPDYYAGHPDCQIATVVVSPYISPGATDSTDHSLYSLLGTTEDILGFKRLGRAVGQKSMRAGLHF